MISPKRPFNEEFRIFSQPFAKNVAKDSEWLQTLNRFIHGEERKNLGEDLVKSYVKTMFCATLRNVSSEGIPVQKKIRCWIFFTTSKSASERRSRFVSRCREDIFHANKKRNLRVFLEKQSPDAFKNPIDNSSSTQIRDGMLDILL